MAVQKEKRKGGVYGSVPESILLDPDLGAREITILSFFIACAAGKKECFEKQSTSLEYLQLSKTCYKKSLAILKKHKYISCTRLKKKHWAADPSHKITLEEKAQAPGKFAKGFSELALFIRL